MTEAEKALEKLIVFAHQSGAKNAIKVFGLTVPIRKALQGVSNTWLDKKAAMADASMVCKLTDENKALKAKTQILLKALKLARVDVKVGRGRDWIIKDMDNAIAAFNSDETGVGL